MKILSFLPMEMLSFDWNAPPQYPTVRRDQHTWVVVQFYPISSNQTRVRLTHIGWKEGDEWDKVFQYFKRAWDVVLGRLEYKFLGGRIDWNDPYRPSKEKTYETR
jgi:phenylpropionate dioxygenase-like ring-hydroxylating dioxygenase large terminal subunit